jgi:hypothetical protein
MYTNAKISSAEMGVKRLAMAGNHLQNMEKRTQTNPNSKASTIKHSPKNPATH